MCGRCFSVVVSSCQALNSYPDADTRNKGKMSQRYETKSVACKKPWLVSVRWGRSAGCLIHCPASLSSGWFSQESPVHQTSQALSWRQSSRRHTQPSGQHRCQELTLLTAHAFIRLSLSHDNSKPRLLWQPAAGDLSKC